MTKRYEFTGETKQFLGRTLHQIRALVEIAAFGVAVGDVGGWIEKEENLSRVHGNAWVHGNAHVSGDAWVHGNARVSGDAWVHDNAWVHGNARVSGDAQVHGNARVSGVNITAVRSDNYTFTIAPTPEGPRIIAGCRYFTFDEARTHWANTRGGTKLGDESLALVDHLERMAVLNGFMEPITAEKV